MKVTIIKGPNTQKNIQACYEYLANKVRKELAKEDSELRFLLSSDINKDTND